MSEKTTIKLDKQNHERLAEQKGEFETWDAFIARLCDDLEGE